MKAHQFVAYTCSLRACMCYKIKHYSQLLLIVYFCNSPIVYRLYTIQAHLVLLYFIFLCLSDTTLFFFFLRNWRTVATLLWARWLVPSFPTACALFMSLCLILVNLIIFQTFFIIGVFLMVICNPWSLTLLL